MTGKIVIVGSGSAAWISAFMFKSLGNCSDITIIEPENNQPIGVGESTTPHFWFFLNRWCPYFNERDFLEKTGSTIKMGVVHSDWKIGQTFINPIDSLGRSVENELGLDVVRTWKISQGQSPAIGYEASAILKGLVPFEFYRNQLIQKANYAYHLNIDRTLDYFREIGLKEGIKIEKGSVVQVERTDRVSSLKLSDDREIKGDFFVDCTGQKRVLGENKFIEFNDLLLDSALTFKRDHGVEIPNYTLAKAEKFGWRWEIPVKDEMHVGLLYNREMIDEGRLQEETGGKIIRFKSGRSEKFISGNVLFVGLSSGFVEPLEATSIHSTLIQLFVFLTEYFRPDISFPNPVLESRYNSRFSAFWDSIRDWIRMHYIGTREDSEFWRESSRSSMSDELKVTLDLYKERMPRESDHHQKIYQSSLIFHVLGGMSMLSPEIAAREISFHGLEDSAMKKALRIEKENEDLIEKFVSHKFMLENI
jgi:hypothetical protein